MEALPMIGCCWCINKIPLAQAVHAEGLEGHFCSEACIIDCFKRHTYISPFPKIRQLQMGTRDNKLTQRGANDECETQNGQRVQRRYEGDWQ